VTGVQTCALPILGEAELPYVMHILSEETQGLPPGGGLSAKYVSNIYI